jgi:hypothetical protein
LNSVQARFGIADFLDASAEFHTRESKGSRAVRASPGPAQPLLCHTPAIRERNSA